MIVFISSLPGQRPPCGLRLWSGAAGPVLAGQATLLVELGCDADVRGVSPVSQYSIQSPSAVVKLELWPGQRFGDKRTWAEVWAKRLVPAADGNFQGPANFGCRVDNRVVRSETLYDLFRCGGDRAPRRKEDVDVDERPVG